MKLNWKKMIGKAYVAGTGFALALTPTFASATAPSAYVNKLTEGVYGEIQSIAFKLALVAMAIFIIGYFTTADDHKKGKFKGSAITTAFALLILGVLPSLVQWLQGLF